jgi:hypothetical protein
MCHSPQALQHMNIVTYSRSPKFQSNSAKIKTSLQVTNEVFVGAKKFQNLLVFLLYNSIEKSDLAENESMKLLCWFRFGKERETF